MHLTQKQADRFTRLLDILISYTDCRLMITGRNLQPDHIDVSADERSDILAELWDDPSLLDDFLTENPYDLPAADMRTIEEWAQYHLTDIFFVTEFTSQYSVFVIGEYAFGVVGISKDISAIMSSPLPTMVFTTLLPFEGKIVCDSLESSPLLALDENMTELFEESSMSVASEYGIISSASALILAYPEIEDAIEQYDKLSGADQCLQDHENEGQRDKTAVHKGVLAGLSEEDRDEAIYDAFDQHCKDQGFVRSEFFEMIAFKGTPRFTLKETLECFSKDELLKMAKKMELERYSHLKKADLAELMSNALLEDAQGFLEAALSSFSPEVVAFFDKLAEGGGTFTIDAHELSDAVPVKDRILIAEPVPPILNFYYEKNVFTYVIPKEFLAIYPLIDKEYVEQVIRQKDLIQKSAVFFTQMCGAISVYELDQWLRENCLPDLDETTILATLLASGIEEDSEFGLFFPDERGDIYLVHYSLTDDYLLEAFGDEDDAEAMYNYRDYLLESHEEIERKNFTVQDILGSDPLDRFLELPQTKDLLAFLDAHVPDGEDDFTFADNVLSNFFEVAKLAPDSTIVMEFFESFGLPSQLTHSKDFINTANAVVMNTPHWVNNGWTDSELYEKDRQKDTSGFGQLKLLEGGLANNVQQKIPAKKSVGRNEPCPCKSGKKYKNCCGAPEKSNK